MNKIYGVYREWYNNWGDYPCWDSDSDDLGLMVFFHDKNKAEEFAKYCKAKDDERWAVVPTEPEKEKYDLYVENFYSSQKKINEKNRVLADAGLEELRQDTTKPLSLKDYVKILRGLDGEYSYEKPEYRDKFTVIELDIH